MKYYDEVRLSLGVAKVKTAVGGVEGKRLPLFDYSGKVLLTIKDWNKCKNDEIKRVRSLKGDCLPWVINRRKKDELFRSDSVDMVKGIAEATKTKMAGAGINTVGQLLSSNINNLPGISQKKMKQLRDAARHAHPYDAPADLVKNYKAEVNPYKALYGDEWESKIAKCTYMSSYVPITDLIDHVYEETRQAFVASKHESDFLFYHDALSLMTSADSIKYMKTKAGAVEGKSLYDHWLLPAAGLNAGTDFAGKPVGNSPELMPLDCSLNKDLDDAVMRHILLSAHLKKDDERKFSLATIKSGARAYRLLWDPAHGPHGGSPTTDRILNDINKVLTSLRAIYDANGRIVEGLGNRNGRRNLVNETRKKRGGKRVRGEAVTMKWTHPLLTDVRKELIRTNEPVNNVE